VSAQAAEALREVSAVRHNQVRPVIDRGLPDDIADAAGLDDDSWVSFGRRG
jgi:hypothetical protein